MINKTKSLLKKIIPNQFIKNRQVKLQQKIDINYAELPIDDVFNKIYDENVWGDGEAGHYSGPGSHDPKITSPYFAAITEFVGKFSETMTAVDVGCGDFGVGRHIAPLFSKYIGCDIVSTVIEKNKERYGFEFLTLDATSEFVPVADVVFIREVLQHLSNADIKRVMSNVEGRCKHLIVTNSFSSSPNFTANKDITTGPFARRADKESGVDLSEPPFNLIFSTSEILCEVQIEDSKKMLRTTLFTF